MIKKTQLEREAERVYGPEATAEVARDWADKTLWVARVDMGGRGEVLQIHDLPTRQVATRRLLACLKAWPTLKVKP